MFGAVGVRVLEDVWGLMGPGAIREFCLLGVNPKQEFREVCGYTLRARRCILFNLAVGS